MLGVVRILLFRAGEADFAGARQGAVNAHTSAESVDICSLEAVAIGPLIYSRYPLHLLERGIRRL